MSKLQDKFLSRTARRGLAAAFVAMALAGCATGPDVRIDRDPAADLEAYRTFSFYDVHYYDMGKGAPTPYTTLAVDHMRTAVTAEMAKRGYIYQDRAPDLRVVLRMYVARRTEVASQPSAGPFGARWGGIETRDFREGALVVELIDTRRNAAVWHGAAEGRLAKDDLQDPAKTIGDSVAEIFAKGMPMAGAAS